MFNIQGSINSIGKKINIRRLKDSYNIVQLWDEVVGEVVSKNSRPLYFAKGIIHVEVTSSTWINEMSFLKEDIIERFNQRITGEKVIDIKFKTTSINDQKYKPVLNKKVDKTNENNKKDDTKIIISEKLTDQDKELIEKEVISIDDDKLKNSLKVFFEKARKKELTLMKNGWKKCKTCNCPHKEKDEFCKPCKVSRMSFNQNED